MTQNKILTGIKPTGTPHLGNYIGAIRPAICTSVQAHQQSFFFLADYHALIGCREPELLHASTRSIAACWLALGLDTNQALFYRQSDIPEIPQLCWILSCLAAKGLMNRAHAYKAQVHNNLEREEGDPDKGVTMGLYSYPVLMAADILLFQANRVPVGQDQVQHIEMARDIAGRFNHHYGHCFVLPEAVVADKGAVLNGLDGRKMSKSYNNVIPLFCSASQLRKLIMKIKTNSLAPGEPKDPDSCTLFQIFSAFNRDADALAHRRQQYADGAAWGTLKQELFEFLDDELKAPRAEYERLVADPAFMEEQLLRGAEKAREHTVPFMETVRRAVGIRALHP